MTKKELILFGASGTQGVEDQRLTISNSPASCINRGALDPPDLTTFAQWLQLQPVSVHAGLLEEIARDLYRRKQWPYIAGEVKALARTLMAFAQWERG